MAHKMDIVELFEKVEAFKAADPRSNGTVNDLIAMYVDIGEMIHAAGWGRWEYEVTMARVWG